MFRFTLIFLIVFLWLVGCSQDPYVEQINKAHETLNQGKLNNSKEQLKEAIKEYSKAYSYALFALEKKYDALFNLAMLHAFSGQYKECIEVISKAYEIRRDEPSLFYFWGMCYANQAKISLDSKAKKQSIDKALSTYKMGLQIDASDYQLNYGIGIFYGFIIKDYVQAIEYLNTAHQTFPEDINTLFALANINYKLGHVEESVEYFETIKRLTKPSNSSYKQAQKNLDKIK